MLGIGGNVARLYLGLVVLGCGIPLFAQPSIGQRGIVNAGSYTPFGIPGGGIARGSVFSIFGAGLGPASSPALAFPLSTTLGGVSIKVSNANGSVSADAIPLFVSPGQINAIMPSNAPLGRVSVVVTVNGVRSLLSPIDVVNSTFGIYAISSGGFGPGVFQNFNSQTDQPVNSLTVPAQPGQVVTLWGTGLGPVTFPDNVAPTPGSLPTDTEVFVGGKPAVVSYSGRSPCCSGTDQIVFTVPADAPLGCWVPVQVRTEKSIVSNTATLAISSSRGTACSEPANAFGAKFAAGGKIGWIHLFRLAERKQAINLTIDTTSDYVSETYRNEPGGPFVYNPLYSLPPAGTCATYTGRGDLFWKDAIPGMATAAPWLDAGAQLGAAGLRVPQPKTATASYAPLGWYQTGIGTFRSTLKLNPGNVQVQGLGGADVGTFQVNVASPTPLSWTNRDQLPASIDRSQPLTVNYSSVPSGHTVLISGGYFSPAMNATAMFVCQAPVSSTSFTVPAYVLSAIPARGQRERTSGRGLLMVGSTPLASPSAITPTGLDYGAVLLSIWSGKEVLYR